MSESQTKTETRHTNTRQKYEGEIKFHQLVDKLIAPATDIHTNEQARVLSPAEGAAKETVSKCGEGSTWGEARMNCRDIGGIYTGINKRNEQKRRLVQEHRLVA
jgi:hypothetical protein